MDYIIGDKILIPDGYYKYYTESVANLPVSFFPNPSNIVISKKKFTKSLLEYQKINLFLEVLIIVIRLRLLFLMLGWKY